MFFLLPIPLRAGYPSALRPKIAKSKFIPVSESIQPLLRGCPSATLLFFPFSFPCCPTFDRQRCSSSSVAHSVFSLSPPVLLGLGPDSSQGGCSLSPKLTGLGLHLVPSPALLQGLHPSGMAILLSLSVLSQLANLHSFAVAVLPTSQQHSPLQGCMSSEGLSIQDILRKMPGEDDPFKPPK